MIRRFAPFVALLLLLAACGQAGQRTKGEGEKSGPADEPVNETHCYLQVTHGAPVVRDTGLAPGPVDTLYIRLDILGELVNGVYNWLPAEKDVMKGTFTGTMENGVVTALYTYRAEGKIAKQEILFKLTDRGLLVGTGDLVQDQGVWLFKDKSKAEYGAAVPEVDCE